jgi:serine/threonine protein kinase
MEYDLAGLLGNPNVCLKAAEIKCFMQQLLKGVDHLHSNNIIHRDLKGNRKSFI